MKVSVVIPAYNEEEYLGACLKALQTQTEAPDEIIVVDNNSSDRTAAIAKKGGAKVVTEREAGITPARNAGFNVAKGDIIARCDADTRPFPDWIARIKQDLADPTVIGVTGTNKFYDAPAHFKRLWEKLFTVIYFKGTKLIIGHEGFYGSNMAFRRRDWQKIKNEVCNDDRLVHEDIDLSIHLGWRGRIIYDRDLLVGCSTRAVKVSLSTLIERLAKWPRTRLVHTRFRRFVRPGKKHSSTAQNSKTQ